MVIILDEKPPNCKGFTMIRGAIFLLTFGWLVTAPAPSFAISLWKDDPIAITQTHCRLLMLADNPNRQLVPELLDAVIGKENYQERLDERAKQLFIGMTGGMPDFGFVIGPRWDTATRDQRRDFNQAFTRFIYRRFMLAPAAGQEEFSCLMDSKMTLLSEKPKAYLATVTTVLKDKNNAPLTLTYRLEKYPPGGWNMQHMNLGATDLHDSFNEILNQLLSEQGYEGAIAWLNR